MLAAFMIFSILCTSCTLAPKTQISSPLPSEAPLNSPILVASPVTQDSQPLEIPNGPRGEGVIYFTMSMSEIDQIFRLSLKDLSVTRITTSTNSYFSFALSPDHKWGAIAYSETDPKKSEIALMNMKDFSVKKLTNYNAITLSPAWFPDSKRVMFHSNKDGEGKFKLFTINLDGSELQEWQTISDVGNKFMPLITADGGRVFFVGTPKGAFEIMSAKADGSDIKTIVATANKFETQPAISSNASLLAFTSFRFSNELPVVFISNGDGSNATPAFGTKFPTSFSCFSPNNEYIAAIRKENNAWQIVAKSIKSPGAFTVLYESLTKIDHLNWAEQ